MSTTKVLKINKFNMAEFASTVGAKISESLGDMVITVIVTGVMMIYIPQIHPVYVDSAVPGLFLSAMIVQLLIRIVHRFDNSYTAHEVGQMLQRFEDHFDARLDDFMNNYIP